MYVLIGEFVLLYLNFCDFSCSNNELTSLVFDC